MKKLEIKKISTNYEDLTVSFTVNGIPVRVKSLISLFKIILQKPYSICLDAEEYELLFDNFKPTRKELSFADEHFGVIVQVPKK